MREGASEAGCGICRFPIDLLLAVSMARGSAMEAACHFYDAPVAHFSSSQCFVRPSELTTCNSIIAFRIRRHIAAASISPRARRCSAHIFSLKNGADTVLIDEQLRLSEDIAIKNGHGPGSDGSTHDALVRGVTCQRHPRTPHRVHRISGAISLSFISRPCRPPIASQSTSATWAQPRHSAWTADALCWRVHRRCGRGDAQSGAWRIIATPSPRLKARNHICLHTGR